jgi:hypothetical protein
MRTTIQADFGRREDPDVERRQGQVDDLRRRILGAVDDGVPEERLEVGGERNERSGNGRARHGSDDDVDLLVKAK